MRDTQLSANDLREAIKNTQPSANDLREAVSQAVREMPTPPPVVLPPQPPPINVSPNQPSVAPRKLEPEFESVAQPTYPTRTLHSAVSRAAHQLPDGRWELGSDFQSAMVKSANTMVVSKLGKDANYNTLKEWSSAVEDWVYSHT